MAQLLNTTSRFGRPAAQGVDADEVRLCDLGGKGWHQEDLENALGLWRRPVVLIAGRNLLDRLPKNTPCSIIYLDLSWNRIAYLEGFAALPSLRELDLSHNGVQGMLGLVSNTDLRVLRISHNCIRCVEGLHQMKRLQEADLSHNVLKTAADVRALSLNSAIRRLRIEGNPFCATGVKCGSYEIVMQHFLPSMSLLDGKPPPGLCNSPPPPPPVTRTLHHGAPPPSNRTISRGGRLPVGGSSDDISMIRKWRDLAIVVAGRENPLLSHDQGGTPVAVVEKTWARSGSGGPTVDPGSYAEIFQESQRKKRRGCSSPPGEAGGSIVPRTTTTSRRENRGTRNENHVAARRREATRVENCAITSIGLRRRKPAGPEVGDHNVDGPGVSTRGAHGAVYSASNSLASYPGLTREERVTARRLALNQAQCRDNLGSGMVQRRRIVSRKTCVSSVRRNADARPSELTRLRGKRSNVDPPLTARGYPSAGRQADGGVSMETLRPGHNQVHAAGHRRSLVDGEGGSDEVGSTGMVSYRGSSSKFNKTRLLASQGRSHEENIRPGAKRSVKDPRKPGTQQLVGRWNFTGLSSRRSGGSVAAGSHGGGSSSTRARNTPAASKVGQGRGVFQPFRIRLGQGGHRTPRPMAPHALRCTPRDDAKPWREGASAWRGALDCERVTGHESKGLSQWPVTGEGAGKYAPLGQDESAGRRALPHAEEKVDIYHKYALNNGDYGGVADHIGDGNGDDGCGRGGYHSSGNSSWDESPFASPPSTATLVQRVVSARTSSTGAHEQPSTTAASRARCIAATRTRPASADQQRCAEDIPSQILGPRASITANDRRTKSGNGSAGGSMPYRVDAHHVPDDLPGQEDTRRGQWRTDESLFPQHSCVVPHYYTEHLGAGGGESHGMTTLHVRPEIAMCAPHELSGWSDAGNPIGTKPPISSRRQHWDAQARGSRRPPPATQPSSPLKRAPISTASKERDRTTSTRESGADRNAADTTRAYDHICSSEPKIMWPVQRAH